MNYQAVGRRSGEATKDVQGIALSSLCHSINRAKTIGSRSVPAFTLIELILALAISAILAVSLYAAMRAAFGTKTSAENAVEPSRTAAMAMDYLASDFQCALPPTGILAGAFVGTDQQDDRGRDGDDVVFYTTADAPYVDGAANGDIKMVELTVIVPDNSTDHVLVRRVTRNLLSQLETTPEDEVLCRGVGGFNVRYYDGSEWVDSWDSTQQADVLPTAVEVTLELDRPTGPDQPPRTLRYTRVFPLPCSALTAQLGGTQ
jgi:type II secretion system protein J